METRRKFSRELKLEAVRLVTARDRLTLARIRRALASLRDISI